MHLVSVIESVKVHLYHLGLPVARPTNYFFGAFFLPATVLRFPLRVRLLVLVR